MKRKTAHHFEFQNSSEDCLICGQPIVWALRFVRGCNYPTHEWKECGCEGTGYFHDFTEISEDDHEADYA